ncbi:hypothetical protein V2O64_10635 [Verrucomicrobiaceae bacterium 227]
MKFYRLLPLIALLGLGCKNENSSGGPAKDRPVVTVEQQALIDQSLAGQKIGALLTGRTSWLKGEEFVKGGLDRAPDLYLLYYSASW